MSLPPLRRIVTGHDAEGRAVVTDDALHTPKQAPSGVAAFTLLWTTPTMPVDNDDTTDGGTRQVGLSLPGGTVLRIVDMMPGRRSALHRTNSLDYGIVLSGELELELDDGATTLVKAGDVVIQRGTIHAWTNPSTDTPARMAFVLVDAAPATVNGTPLPELLPSAAVKPAV